MTRSGQACWPAAGATPGDPSAACTSAPRTGGTGPNISRISWTLCCPPATMACCKGGELGQCCGSCAECTGDDDHSGRCVLLGGLSAAVNLELVAHAGMAGGRRRTECKGRQEKYLHVSIHGVRAAGERRPRRERRKHTEHLHARTSGRGAAPIETCSDSIATHTVVSGDGRKVKQQTYGLLWKFAGESLSVAYMARIIFRCIYCGTLSKKHMLNMHLLRTFSFVVLY
ncbi:uncharacterized protein LOC119286444 [Triticum dicoccoides]|uniref:uncharacterized protein LOC119286444 n=1 Tax=Triticum dicoccoides TaxID=85692 RepID=UPI000E7CD1D7|nr:uncharacterized protein LOC119286444 [Triticum dicoccoides]